MCDPLPARCTPSCRRIGHRSEMLGAGKHPRSQPLHPKQVGYHHHGITPQGKAAPPLLLLQNQIGEHHAQISSSSSSPQGSWQLSGCPIMLNFCSKTDLSMLSSPLKVFLELGSSNSKTRMKTKTTEPPQTFALPLQHASSLSHSPSRPLISW